MNSNLRSLPVRTALWLIALSAFLPLRLAAQGTLAPATVGKVYTLLAESGEAEVNLLNWGSTDVTSFTYTLYYMDTQKSSEPATVTLETPLTASEFQRKVRVPIDAGESLSTTDVIMNITAVNGGANNATVPYTYITRCTVRKIPVKRVLCEEYTGLWCQYCPRGMVMMEALERLYPDRFVGIVAHKYDKLGSNAYTAIMNTYGSSTPSVWFDRDSKQTAVDSREAFENQCKAVAMMNVGVSARWDKQHQNILVESEVEPCMTSESGNKYAVAYVLTASGLQSDNYVQAYSVGDLDDVDETLFPEVKPFRGNATDIAGLTYNHVALASLGVDGGVDGSLPETLEPNVLQTHEVTFSNISQYNLIQDEKQLRVVAFVLNTTTNKVENAAWCNVDDYAETFPVSFAASAWTTLYTARAYTLPAGVQAYAVSASGDVTLVADGSTDDCRIPARTAVLLRATQGETYDFPYAESGNVVVYTSLFGTSQTERTMLPAGYSASGTRFYKLTLDESGTKTGFYYGAEDGKAFENEAGHCYLALDVDNLSSEKVQGFAIDDDKTTGIRNAVTETLGKAPRYDLSGRQLRHGQTAPDIVIQSGRKTLSH